MSIDSKQFTFSILRVLARAPREVGTDSAVQLLLGTAAQESRFGTYLRQIHGPALGFFQIEPGTAMWLEKDLPAELRKWLIAFRGTESVLWALEYRIDYQIACCRMRYYVDPEPLPDAREIEALGYYWKRVYNTFLGKGTVSEFVTNYRKYVS